VSFSGYVNECIQRRELLDRQLVTFELDSLDLRENMNRARAFVVPCLWTKDTYLHQYIGFIFVSDIRIQYLIEKFVF
jgi:hypothetical protein